MNSMLNNKIAINFYTLIGIIILGIITAHPTDVSNLLVLSPLVVFLDFEHFWQYFFIATTFSMTLWSGFFWGLFKEKAGTFILPLLVILGIWIFHLMSNSQAGIFDMFTYIKLAFFPLSGFIVGSVFSNSDKLWFIDKSNFFFKLLLIVPLYFFGQTLANLFYYFNVFIFQYPPLGGIEAISQVILINYAVFTAIIISVVFAANVVFGYLRQKIDYIFSIIFTLIGGFLYSTQEDVTTFMLIGFIVIAGLGNVLGYCLKIGIRNYWPKKFS